MLITALHYHHLSIRIRMCSVHYLFNQFEWRSRGQRRWKRKESSSRSVAFPQFHISLKFTPFFSLSLSLPSLSLLAYLVGLSSFWHFGKDQKSNVSNSPTHTRCDTHTHRDCTHTHTHRLYTTNSWNCDKQKRGKCCSINLGQLFITANCGRWQLHGRSTEREGEGEGGEGAACSYCISSRINK